MQLDQLKLFLCVSLALCLAMLASAPKAASDTWLESLSSQARSQVLDHLRWGGIHASPPAQAPAGEPAAWRAHQAEQAAVPIQAPTSYQQHEWEELHLALVHARQQARQLPKWSSMTSRIALPASAASVGLWIGSTVNSKLLHFGINVGPPAGGVTDRWLVPLTAGYQLAVSAPTPITVPADGFAMAYRRTGFSSDQFQWWTGDEACNSHMPDPGAPPYMQVLGPSDALCFLGWDPFGQKIYDDFRTWAYWTRDPGTPLGPIRKPLPGEPYDYYVPGNAAPTQQEYEQLAEQALDASDQEQLRRWYEHQLEPDRYPDPTTPENEDHRCDVSVPTLSNPGGNVDPAPHTVKDPVPYEVAHRPSATPNAPDPYLRWGQTSWGGAHIDNWPGWGWRHIAAKHGWSPADEAATRATLAAPVTHLEQGTSMVYKGAEYSANGAICQRSVVVQFATQSGDPSDMPKGIITSYGSYVRDAG